MMEMIGGVLGAGASLASGIMAAEAAEYSANVNWSINLMNYMQREREREESIALALKQKREQQLGTTDIRGTRTHFIPGRGWVTEGAPEVLEMMKLQDAEQRKVLEQDLPMRRKVMARNYLRGLEEEGVADTYRRMLSNVRQRSDEGIAADLYAAQTMGLQEASADAGRRIWAQALRTGQNSNFDEIARGLSREANNAYAKAALSSKIAARGQGFAEATAKRNQLASLYNMFASRANQLPDVQYKPQNVDFGNAADASRAAQASGQQALQATMMKGGTLDYIQPNYGWANAVGGAGNALASAFRMGGAAQRYRGGGGDSGGGVQGFAGGSDIYGGADSGIYVNGEAV